MRRLILGAFAAVSVLGILFGVLSKEDVQESPRQIAGTPFLAAQEDTSPAALPAVESQSKRGVAAIECSGGVRGNGFLISERGIVLTAAHIAFVLLKEDHACMVYGSGWSAPARLLYLPSLWVTSHAQNLRSSDPKGTGEHDYAFLLVEGDEPFISIPLGEYFPKPGQPVFLSFFPSPSTSSPRTSKGVVNALFTFKENTEDLFSFYSDTKESRGISGGAVVDSNGNLMGMAVTLGEKPEEVRAITLDHIRRSLEAHGITLSLLIEGSLTENASAFNATVAPSLRTLLP